MIKDKCNHEWRLLKRAGFRDNVGTLPSLFKCDKCKARMTASELFQLETVKHLTGFQKWIATIAIVISSIALIISIFK